MRAALEILGYKETYHFDKVVTNIRDCDMWLEALDAKYSNKGRSFGRREYDQLLGHCSAVTDTPCIIFYAELMDAYPEAQVILVKRQFESWYRSFQVVIDGWFAPSFVFLATLDPQWMGRICRLARSILKNQFRAENKQEFSKNAKGVYENHYEKVKSVTAKHNLLEYELGSGWKPLCDFLGKNVPDEDFPWVNESKMLQEKFNVLAKRSLMRSLRNLVVAGSAVAVIGVAVYLAI